MSSIVLIDTSVLLNVLDVPGRNQNRAEVLGLLEEKIDSEDHLFIPLATIIETGNHLAHLPGSGGLRRTYADRFVSTVQEAINNQAPWRLMALPDVEHVLNWLSDFPDSAMRQVGMGDQSIKKDWEELCRKYSMSRVLVWSVDGDLSGLDRIPKKKK